MKQGAIAVIFTALLLATASVSATAYHFEFNKSKNAFAIKDVQITPKPPALKPAQQPISRNSGFQFPYKQTPFWKNLQLVTTGIPQLSVVFPSLGINLPQQQLILECENRMAQNDVFISRCAGSAPFNVDAENLSPVQIQSLRATLVLTNHAINYTFELPLGFAREGNNAKQFSAGDLTDFDSWNIRVCSGNVCATSPAQGTMLCNMLEQN